MTIEIMNNNEEERTALIKRMFCKGATDDEMMIFVEACKRTNLDPFVRQIYAVKRWDQATSREVMSIQVGIDGFRLIAERTGRYMPGKECAFAYKDGKVSQATAYVKKLASDGTWHEIAQTVHWEEYAAKKKDGNLTSMWNTKPHIMLGKCAESAVLRKAFPADLSGLYTSEEMEKDSVKSEIEEEKPKSAPPCAPTPQYINEAQLKFLQEAADKNIPERNKAFNWYKIQSFIGASIPIEEFEGLRAALVKK